MNNTVLVNVQAALTGQTVLISPLNLAGADVTGDLPLTHLAQASGASTLLGRGSAAGAGDFQEITLGTGMAMTGTTLSAAGTVVQVVNTQTGASATGSTIIPYDDTIPQITEGTEFMTLAITPTNASNYLRIEVVFMASSNTGVRNLCVALFQDATADALATAYYSTSLSTYGCLVVLNHYMTAGTASSTTFRIRAGVDISGIITFNGTIGQRRFGGVNASCITITEIAA